MHTFYPRGLIPGTEQGHLLILVNKSLRYLETVKAELRKLEEQPQVASMNREEFDENGNHIYKVFVMLLQPN